MATPIPENRTRWTIAELARAAAAAVHDLAPEQLVTGIATDSRQVPAGALFVALRGETHDGHDFVPAARERGAIPLVAADAGVTGPRLETADPLAALGRIARAYVERAFRADGPRPVLAIGGAAGKTTTKSLAAAAAQALFGEPLVTAGNLNNRIGVPMTLLTLAPRHRVLVLECGTSVPGEIAELGRIVRPDVALVTNVGLEHSERLGGLAAIADEEAALLAAAGAAAVTNADDPLLVERLPRATAPRRLLFGRGAEADVRLAQRSVRADGGAELRFEVGAALARPAPGQLTMATPLVGAAAAENVSAALAGVLALLGRPADASELARVAAALAGVTAVPGRLQPVAAGNVLVLDDSYNSNPKSLSAALAAARELADVRGARLLVALGDMLELGDHAAAAHDELVRAADRAGAARLLAVGSETAAAVARVVPRLAVSLFPDSATAAAELTRLVASGDLLLVKGSRGTRMERLVEALARPPGPV